MKKILQDLKILLYLIVWPVCVIVLWVLMLGWRLFIILCVLLLLYCLWLYIKHKNVNSTLEEWKHICTDTEVDVDPMMAILSFGPDGVPGDYFDYVQREGRKYEFLKKHYNYELNASISIYEQKIEQRSYPMSLLPSISDLIEFTFAKNAKTKKKGLAELIAYYHLDKAFGNRVFANAIVSIAGHKYEPDFAYINKEKNIFIDIEIDEPYTASKKPTHYLDSLGKSVDYERDSLFQKAGWYVFRFSEEQFYKQPNRCVKKIHNLLKIIGGQLKNISETRTVVRTIRWSLPEKEDINSYVESNNRQRYFGFNPFRITIVGLIKLLPHYIPIMFRSIWRKNLRKELIQHTFGYVWNKKSIQKKYRTKYQKWDTINISAEAISKHVKMFDKYLVSCINDSQIDLFDLAERVCMDFGNLLGRISFLRKNNVQINLDYFLSKIMLSPTIKSFVNEHLGQNRKRIEYDSEQGTIKINGICMKMLKVEGGTFNMGEGEKSQLVTVSDFYIGETQVTQALWYAVMGYNPSMFFHNPNNPVERVSWNKCDKFISRLNKITGKNFRLPTEAEWEYAARGGNKSLGYKYSGSNKLDEVAWGYSNDYFTTHPVKQKQPNELGIYDMSGNVWEWCSKFKDDSYVMSEYVLGGSAISFETECNPCCRGYAFGCNYDDNFIGFRLALSE